MARRTRKRKDSLNIDRPDIASRVIRFVDDDARSRDRDRDQRLQRYAKFRMWTEGKDWPWENSSDIPLPDMTEKSLSVQDTLHNAVMSQRPPIGANALHSSDKKKEQTVDRLIDYQVFVEQHGERMIGDAADAFVNDGVVTAFIPWVKEMAEVSETLEFPPIPEEEEPIDYFAQIVSQQFAGKEASPIRDGWDWNVGTVKVQFFTNDDLTVQMLWKKTVERFNGPKPMIIDYDDVFHPPRAANLQMPGPSNPGGASHVALAFHPKVDEIKKLAKTKFYDLITKDELDKLENLGKHEDSQEEVQRDDLSGKQENPGTPSEARSHKTLTVYVCFDQFDIDGDGLDEDVIWWVIRENKAVLKAKLLSEMYPAVPPRRPLTGESFLPVRGRRIGIGLLEMLEGLHDGMKVLADQTIDAGTMSIAPPGFYKPTSSMNAEVISFAPGELYPLGNPDKDIKFPKLGDPQAQAMAINIITLLEQRQERLAVVGDLQLGRVPPGKSSALRNFSSLALLSGQGEARPERILRRFFGFLAETWAQIHELNQAFLPKDKQIRISNAEQPSDDPYFTVENREAIKGRFDFAFSANVLNTSKQALQQSLMTLIELYISDFAIQMGITDPDHAYRLLRDAGKAFGQDPDQYIKKPSPNAGPKIMAEDVISTIMRGAIPDGVPEEGAVNHLQKLVEFMEDDRFGLLSQGEVQVFKQYIEKVQQLAAQEQQLLAKQQAAMALQNGGQGGRPAQSVSDGGGTPPVNAGELIDEQLPGAQGIVQ